MNEDILIKHLLGETSGQERTHVEKWLSEAPQNQQFYNELGYIWELSRKVAEIDPPDAQKAWMRFRHRLAVQKNTSLPERKTLPLRWVKAAAAVLLIIVSSFSLYFFAGPESKLLVTRLESAGHSRTDTMSDGSVITLNRESELIYTGGPFRKTRTAELRKGEAFFKVKPDNDAPFTVRTSNALVTVLGTSFNVKIRDGQTEVIVAEGRVSVSAGDSSVILTPGTKILITPQGSLIHSAQEDKLYLYYVDGAFIAENTPLWKLAEAISEAYDTEIILSGSGIRNLSITATFSRQSPDAIMEVIAETFNLELTRRNGKYTLKQPH